MPLTLAYATHADATRIAEIHMAAFASNRMLLAQFPTEAVRDALKSSIRLRALDDIDDPKTVVIVVEDSELESTSSNARPENNKPSVCRRGEGKVIAFAKWALPVSVNEEYAEPAWSWPPGSNLKLIGDWGTKTEEAQARAVRDAPCYRLTFMGTDPAYERRGAATMMVRWGMERGRKERVPTYLESTLEAAPFYRKHGFVDVERFSLEYQVLGHGPSEIYEEISFIYI
ncbi:putative GNAT family acetyltransferase [Hypoxylon sp. NC1633]|nr:putative GNAT family acetyltransferase [Hypoxylon sp. NC1633]